MSRSVAFSCAVDHETRLARCWGDGSAGQLGHGLAASSSAPVEVAGASDVVKISSGGLHACASTFSGEVLCWGDNRHGQLGYGGMARRLEARPVGPTLKAVSDVSAGGSHTCALEHSGTVKCWGWGRFGQLGQGSTASSRHPVTVLELEPAIAVSAGALHSCAVERSGGVKCWGLGARGQLEHNASADSSLPKSVSGIGDAMDVACGYEHSCALLWSGEARCWGRGIDAQLQDHLQIWEATARADMTLEDAAESTDLASFAWTSPLGTVW